jgi:hypothetical protein
MFDFYTYYKKIIRKDLIYKTNKVTFYKNITTIKKIVLKSYLKRYNKNNIKSLSRIILGWEYFIHNRLFYKIISNEFFLSGLSDISFRGSVIFLLKHFSGKEVFNFLFKNYKISF